MFTGYMLFIRVFSRLWHDKSQSHVKWALQEEFMRPFLGIGAKLWSMLHDGQQNRWDQLAINEYMKLPNVTYNTLYYEMKEHVVHVLGLTLLQHPLSPPPQRVDQLR